MADEDDDYLDLCDDGSSLTEDPKLRHEYYEGSSPLPDPSLCGLSSSSGWDPHGLFEVSSSNELDSYSDSESDVQYKPSKVNTNVHKHTHNSNQSSDNRSLKDDSVNSLSNSWSSKNTISRPKNSANTFEINDTDSQLVTKKNSDDDNSSVKRKLVNDGTSKRKQADGSGHDDVSPTKKSKVVSTGSCKPDHAFKKMYAVLKDDISKVTDEKKLQYFQSTQQGKQASLIDSKQMPLTPISSKASAAVKLREMFPDICTKELFRKLKFVDNGTLTEQEIIEMAVEEILSHREETEDVQTAMANPRILPVGHAKNQRLNASKGKSLMKKVTHKNDSMDMGIDNSVKDLSVLSLKAVVSEQSKVKLQWEPSLWCARNEKNVRYVLEMQILPDIKWRTLPKEIAGTVYMLSDLKSIQDYRFRVRARTQFGEESDPSPVASVLRSFHSPSAKPIEKYVDNAEISQQEVSSSTLTCEACQSDTSVDKMVQCCDGHLNCNVCVEKVVKKVLTSADEETSLVCCYSESFECNSSIPESQAKKVLPSLVFELLVDRMNKKASETIEKMTDLYSCPSCQYKVVIEGDLKKFECPHCRKTTCRYCGKTWNGNTDHTECTLNTFMANSSSDVTSKMCTLPEGFKDFVAVELGDENQSEKGFVLSLYMKDSPRKPTVSKVYRIQNPKLWQKYSLTKDHMVEDIGKNNINEQHLFHGCPFKAVGGICREGLDWRMCGQHGTAFGQGTYFAKNSSYSIKYAGSLPTIGAGNIPPSLYYKASGRNSTFGYLLNSLRHSSGLPSNAAAANSNINPSSMFFFGQQPVNINSNTAIRALIGQSNAPSFGNNVQSNAPSFGNNVQSNAPSFGNNVQSNVPSFGNNVQGNAPTFGSSVQNNYPAFGNTVLNGAPSFGRNVQPNQNIFNFGNPPINLRNSNSIQYPDQSGTIESPKEERFLDSGKKYLFLARVLVGRSCQGKHDMRKPQDRSYNSACDNPSQPSVFVIFDSAQCYPEYLIEFS